MNQLTILLGIFASNPILNFAFSCVAILIILGIAIWALRQSPAFELKWVIYIIVAILLIVLFLYFVGALNSMQ